MSWFSSVLMAAWSICSFVLAVLLISGVERRYGAGWGLAAGVLLLPFSVFVAAIPWMLAAELLAAVAAGRAL